MGALEKVGEALGKVREARKKVGEAVGKVREVQANVGESGEGGKGG